MEQPSQGNTAQAFAQYAGNDAAKWQALVGTTVTHHLIQQGVVQAVLGSYGEDLRLRVSYNDGKNEMRYPVTVFCNGYFATVTFTPAVISLLEQDRERLQREYAVAQAETKRRAEVAALEADQRKTQQDAIEERRREGAAMALEATRIAEQDRRSKAAAITAQRKQEMTAEALRRQSAIGIAIESVHRHDAVMADPQRQQELQARKEFAALKTKYGAERHADTSALSPLNSILMRLEEARQLSYDDITWLENEQLYSTLARYREAIFRLTNNSNHLTAACRAWRRAGEPVRTLALTDTLLALPEATDRMFRAQILTTRGGALRDMERLTEAEECAWEAIHCNETFYPHNLLGAIYFQFG